MSSLVSSFLGAALLLGGFVLAAGALIVALAAIEVIFDSHKGFGSNH